MKTRKEFTFSNEVLFADNMIVARGTKFVICTAQPIEVEVFAVEYLNSKSITLIVVDKQANRYMLEYGKSSEQLWLKKDNKYLYVTTYSNITNYNRNHKMFF